MHHSYRSSDAQHSASWVVAVGATSPSPSSLPDAGVLSLGASAGLNHDQRRAVLQRVDELDAALAEAQNAFQAETGAARELEIARARAHAETVRLRDESNAVLDAVRVGGAVWRGLNVGGGPSSGGGGRTNGSGAPRTPPGSEDGTTTAPTGAGARATAESELEVLRRGQAAAQKLLIPKEVRTQLQTLADEIAAAEADIQASPVTQWKERCTQLEHDQHRAHRELGELAERRRALEAAQNQMARQLDEAQRREAQQVSAFEACKAEHAAKERAMEEREEAARQENLRLQQQLEALQADAEKRAAHRCAGEEQLAEIEVLFAERAEHRAQGAAVRAKRQQVFAEKARVGAELVAAKADLDRAHREEAQQRELADALSREQAEWEELELTKHRILREELDELHRELDALESLEKALQENPESKRVDEELAGVLENTRAKELELERVQQELKGLSEHLETQVRLRDEYVASVATARELEALVSARRSELQDLQSRHDERSSVEVAHAEAAAKLAVYRQAAALLKETAEQEKRLDVGL